MTDLEVRVIRLEEAVRDARRLAQAALEMASRALQQASVGGGFGGLAGSLIWGRAVGTIDARSGTTLGTGVANLSSAPDGELTEGTTARDVLNAVVLDIADNAWLGMLPDDRGQLIVLFVGDPCDDLSEPA